MSLATPQPQPLNLFPEGEHPLPINVIWLGKVPGFPVFSKATVHLWITNGVTRRVDGKPVTIRLESRRIGGHHFTCQQWLREFVGVWNEPQAYTAQTVERRRLDKLAAEQLADV